MAEYLLSYEASAAAFMQPQLQSFIKQHKLIAQWSQPYQGLYLLKSDADLSALVETFDEFFARRVLHVICPINPEASGGILPAYVWEWLKTPIQSSLQRLLASYLEEQPPRT